MNLQTLTSALPKPWLTINCESVSANELDISEAKIETITCATCNAGVVFTNTVNCDVTACNRLDCDEIAPRETNNTIIRKPRMGVPGFEYFMPQSVQGITAGETLYYSPLLAGMEFQSPVHGTFYFENTASTTLFTFPLVNTWSDLAGPIGFTAYSLRGMDQTNPFTFRNTTLRPRVCMVTFSLTHILDAAGPAPANQICELSVDLNGVPIPQKTAESASTTAARCTGMSVIITIPAGGVMNLIAQNTATNRGLDVVYGVVSVNSID